ncbi:uncharacterized protein PAF06_013589 [Gastrophryne carolinensis]
MGGNNVKPVPDAQADSPGPPLSPQYKPHQSPAHSHDAFFNPLASPEQNSTPMDVSSAHEEQVPTRHEDLFIEGWGAPFGQAMGEIKEASGALDQLHSQLRGLLTAGNGPGGPQIIDSAHSWETRLSEVRSGLKRGLKQLGDIKSQYEALRTGQSPDPEGGAYLDRQERVKEPIRAQEEDHMENERLREQLHHLEAEKLTLAHRITELQGEVQDLTLLQSDLRTAVTVAERFREEAQEKLERSQRENRHLRAQGLDAVDWPESSPVNGAALQGYRSLPRGVILSSMKDPLVKSNSLMSVPPGESGESPPPVCVLSSDWIHSPVSPPPAEAAVARKERRGSLETLLNQPRATANLTEDSGSFFRRYGGSKRGVFLRWAQDRTCGYKHVVITNFSSSWVDGMALCALLHSYLPDRIPFSQLRPLEKRKNLQLAFQVAKSVGIPPLLSADHMLQLQGPDWQIVLLYVESIYQKFEA